LPELDIIPVSQNQKRHIANNHRMEYFADLFAASYTGQAYKTFLLDFAKDNLICSTHPATTDRLALIDCFITNQNHPLIGLFQESLSCWKLPKLAIAFSVPDIAEAFDNFRPYPIKNTAELHGLFEAAADYLNRTLSGSQNPWPETQEAEAERIVNDLVEKSIRNFMITERWTA
jgi:hypothetical protein